MPDPTERDRALLALFSQLSSGLSAYRLFPGDLGQPSFIQACERIRAAAEQALRYGPAMADIHGSRMRTERGPLKGDDRIERLVLRGRRRDWLRWLRETRELAERGISSQPREARIALDVIDNHDALARGLERRERGTNQR